MPRDLIEVRDRATGETLTSSGNRTPRDAGKGDMRRPTNQKLYEENYDKIDWTK